jgi:signal transduction histidine kinase
MLKEFLTTHREEILEAATSRTSARTSSPPGDDEPRAGALFFIEQLDAVLSAEASADARVERCTASPVSVPAGDPGAFAVLRASHGYIDVAEAVVELAVQHASVSHDDLVHLDRSLGVAVERSLSGFHGPAAALPWSGTERLGFLAHELRNLVGNATMSLDLLERMSPESSPGHVILRRSLDRIRVVVERSLASVRAEANLRSDERVDVADVLRQGLATAELEAAPRRIELANVASSDALIVEVDRVLFSSAIDNLLQNAIKFTRPGGAVVVAAKRVADRIVVDVADSCGGLAEGAEARIFESFSQEGSDRTGLGLGLSSSRRIVRAMRGDIRARNRPPTGCVFTIDLPSA